MKINFFFILNNNNKRTDAGIVKKFYCFDSAKKNWRKRRQIIFSFLLVLHRGNDIFFIAHGADITGEFLFFYFLFDVWLLLLLFGKGKKSYLFCQTNSFVEFFFLFLLLSPQESPRRPPFFSFYFILILLIHACSL